MIDIELMMDYSKWFFLMHLRCKNGAGIERSSSSREDARVLQLKPVFRSNILLVISFTRVVASVILKASKNLFIKSRWLSFALEYARECVVEKETTINGLIKWKSIKYRLKSIQRHTRVCFCLLKMTTQSLMRSLWIYDNQTTALCIYFWWKFNHFNPLSP